MEQYVVEMKNITKSFPGIVANDDVTIQIKKGEIYALLGENGAGKSTIMSILFGMYEPDSGEIIVNGKNVTLKNSNDATALGIGMVHQHFKLIDTYSVAENIVLGVEPMKKTLGILPAVDIKTAERDTLELSQKFGLEVDPKAIIGDLNVSVRQRVEILKMLYRKADILIFDEPTSVLTPQEVDFLLEIMNELRNGGKTIILITHKIKEIKRIADRCAIMCKGKLVDVMEVESSSEQDMANKMVGREVEFNAEKTAPKFGDVVLSVQNITAVNSDKIKTVDDVSFEVHGGEIFAIAGVSGNGQVEVADVIAGLASIKGGKIFLKGKEITQSSIRERAELGISYIPEDRQNVGVIMDFSLRDNLALRNYFKEPFQKRGILQFDKIEEQASEFIEKYDIRSGQQGKTVLRSMSGGNQQKAIIAREIEKDSDLMIFVQPTRGLDMGAIENIHKQILAQRDEGKAILLISLELDEIMNLADTIGVIYGGKLLKISEASGMNSHEVGSYMMGVNKQ